MSDGKQDEKPKEGGKKIIVTKVTKQEKKVEEKKSPEVLDRVINKFEQIGDEVLEAWRKDRKDVSDLIQHLDNTIRHDEDGAAKRHHYEALTSLMNSKMSSSLSAARFVDSMTKFLSVAKTMELGNSKSVDNDLGELMENIDDDDDDDFDEDAP